ncbi:signal transduction histidine kinase [Streptomyces sp. 840.1]|uniref:sensor histidine kinase n=1 Tax=Streptomyces sp. 840.1 TaxID=2485152 RepID=UPI000F47BC15|nr:histidine kinase [Streptomyces sp. 840.1]ROQ67485.1 signal transduction histidine kinase [Streptomyces sp. 840.1]
MNRTDDRLLPVLLLCAQAVVWPGAPLLRGDVPPASALLAAAMVAGVVTAALVLRRSRPVVTPVVVAAACALGAGPLPAGATAVLGTAGVALALFTVATGTDAFTAVTCVVALAAWQLLQGISLHGLSDRNGLDVVLTALLYAAVCGAGLLVRRTHRARRAAEQLLKRAEFERHRLPSAEQRRMERELHDVSAHHLTAVVVTAGAALGLRDRRPELAGQALEFAVETGSEVTRALGAVRAPSPSHGSAPSPQERLLDLVAGFRRLDQQVDCEIAPLPEGAVADAAYGIVREALTNVARYAPGAQTRVLCRYGDTRTDVVVTSTRSPAGAVAHGAGLGSGRGQGFLRSRAREAGGTVHSGPTADGGWEVRAELPGRTATTAEPSAPRSYRVAQVVAAMALVTQPLLPTLVIRSQDASSGTPSAGVLFALLAAGQAMALLWLGRAPRTVYGTLLGLALLWPVAMAAGNYGGPVLLPPALSLLVTSVALAMEPTRIATPRKGRGAVPKPRPAPMRVPHEYGGDEPPPARGHVTATLLTVLVHAAAATAAVLHRGTAAPVWTVVAGTAVGAALTGTAAHLTGRRRARCRRHDRRAHDERVAAWTEEAVRDAWTERRRIAAGLETTVLARTADMVTDAEAGRLDATATRAREALSAMRALLDTVRDGETAPGLRPQPTLQALDLLAHQLRATGRDIEIRLTDRVPERLPIAVDLAAYRAAETVLTAGGEEPATLEVDVESDTLTLTATGVPRAAGSAVRERLTTRIAAVGGTLTTGPWGTVRLRLPLAVVQDNEERSR